MKFNDNNSISFIINLTFFYLNKKFYSHINFNSNFILYKITRERLKAIKVEDIFLKIKKLLKYN